MRREAYNRHAKPYLQWHLTLRINRVHLLKIDIRYIY